MQHIKSYFSKIENILAQRKSPAAKKTKSAKGFAAPAEQKSNQAPVSKKDAVELVADYIEGIREARDELMKAKK
jgi:ribosome-binding protein aMBF1 (putative translation factor)